MRLRFEYTENGDSHHEPEDFGSWWETNDRTYHYAYISDREYGSHPIDFPVNVGDTVYLLYVTYSAGDSFGNSTGNVEEVWVFNDADSAEKARLIIEKDYETNKDNFNNLYIGLSRPIYTGTWKGYFESLESVTVVPLVIKEGP